MPRTNAFPVRHAAALLLGAAALLAWPATSPAASPAATPAHAAPTHKVSKPAARTVPANAVRKTAARAAEAADLPAYGQREDLMQWADELAQRHGLERDWTRQAIAQARFVPAVARLIMPPPAGTAKNWAAYRARFVEPQRIAAGLGFWIANEDWLTKAEAQYGVPPEIVVGIVGVETIYGRHTGNFRVLDALATLAFDFPPGRRDRSAFFRDELEQFLVLCAREGWSPLVPKGSYAGAIGLPQFMPSSILKHAVDFDGDGRVDLAGSTADVIGSVAHYLAEFGWQRGMPTHFGVAAPVEVADRAVLLGPDILPSFSAQDFAERGAALAEDAKTHPGKLALVELQNGDAAPTYVAGTGNFYAITRYNWSAYYALAVIELGEAIRRRR